jgi:hypothetical protein
MAKHLIMTPKILEMLKSGDRETQRLGLILMGYNPITRYCYTVLKDFLRQYKIKISWSYDQYPSIITAEMIYFYPIINEKEETTQTTKTSV